MLADEILGEPVEDWLARRRKAGHSWQQIRDEMREATDRRISVTPNSLRVWLEERPTEQPARAS